MVGGVVGNISSHCPKEECLSSELTGLCGRIRCREVAKMNGNDFRFLSSLGDPKRMRVDNQDILICTANTSPSRKGLAGQWKWKWGKPRFLMLMVMICRVLGE